jgi:hypothetical protein
VKGDARRAEGFSIFYFQIYKNNQLKFLVLQALKRGIRKDV